MSKTITFTFHKPFVRHIMFVVSSYYSENYCVHAFLGIRIYTLSTNPLSWKKKTCHEKIIICDYYQLRGQDKCFWRCLFILDSEARKRVEKNILESIPTELFYVFLNYSLYIKVDKMVCRLHELTMFL